MLAAAYALVRLSHYSVTVTSAMPLLIRVTYAEAAERREYHIRGARCATATMPPVLRRASIRRQRY